MCASRGITSVVVVVLLTLATQCNTLDFSAWHKVHGRAPPTEADRYWFNRTLQEIERLKVVSPFATFVAGPKANTDWSKQPKYIIQDTPPAIGSASFSNSQIAAALNTSVDWQMTPQTKSLGAVTRIKNQGDCGSCWAFSVVAAIEGTFKKNGQSLTALSEQYILDCLAPTGGLNGCGGGDIQTLAMTLATNTSYSLPMERLYEYKSYDNTTHSCNKSVTGVVTVKGAKKVVANAGQNVEDAMAAWVLNNGPLAVGVTSWASAWQLYQSGIADCPPATSIQQLDHGVTLVGYGVENIGGTKVPYWKIKNSWTPMWGEGGYIRLRRGNNACGVSLLTAGVLL